MEITLGKTAGFCPGITAAVSTAEKELDNKEKIECLGDLLHNNEVLTKLKNKGLKIIEKIEEANEEVIIRAHGVTRQIYEYAKNKNIKLIDCTCRKVLHIHKLAEELAKDNYFIILVGEKNHPEIIGTYSFCGDKKIIVENMEQTKEAVKKIEKEEIEKVAVLTQTTYSLKKFDEIEQYLKQNISKELNIKNCICNATELRQNETEKIAKNVEYMIIIGGKKSSNTNKLYEISKANCENAIKIENVKELKNIDFNKYNKIGIMAGASTPKESIEEVINYLKENSIKQK